MQMGVRDFLHTQKSKSAKNSVVDLAEVAMFLKIYANAFTDNC